VSPNSWPTAERRHEEAEEMVGGDFDEFTIGSVKQIPTEKEVCGMCRGEGKSSAYLGSFTQSELTEDFEFRENYMSGFYDKQCTTCHGLRVVDVLVDYEEPIYGFTPEEVAAVNQHIDDECEYRAQCEAERRMGA
jgi:hypothetical protein